MYSTCLYCHSRLGSNQLIEPFPVGRRLAFDASKGRLWVVCRRCSRWNLSPLEERWEAIEACERSYRSAKLRASTENIGLARLADGLDLVRVGAAPRPELASWRYWRLFTRRRNRKLLVGLGGATAAGALLVTAGPSLGLAGICAYLLANYGYGRVRDLRYYFRPVSRIDLPGGQRMELTLDQITEMELHSAEEGWSLRLPYGRPDSPRPWQVALPLFDIYHSIRRKNVEAAELRGEDAIRAAGLLLPHINAYTAGRRVVEDAVDFLERAGDAESCFELASRTEATSPFLRGRGLMRALSAPVRLALEMAAAERIEDSTDDGDLRALEEAWREAERIAAIADDLLLPASVAQRLEELRSGRREG